MFILGRLLKIFNLEAVKRNDFNSPLPDVEHLRKTRSIWDKPSGLSGVKTDLAAMSVYLETLTKSYGAELDMLPGYEDLLKMKLGWGMPYLDLQTLYLSLRVIRPKRYFEVGSGLSTHVASLALKKNAEEGNPCEITCVEPYPSPEFTRFENIRLISKEVQELPSDFFDILEDGDVLFVDSSHIVKVGGDVPFTHLEVLPRLKKGVVIHVHDTPFPYNTPFPADFWIFNPEVPSMFWTEAMLTQAFLCFNDSFEVLLSTPMLRQSREEILRATFPRYKGVHEEPNTFSSLWMKRVK